MTSEGYLMEVVDTDCEVHVASPIEEEMSSPSTSPEELSVSSSSPTSLTTETGLEEGEILSSSDSPTSTSSTLTAPIPIPIPYSAQNRRKSPGIQRIDNPFRMDDPLSQWHSSTSSSSLPFSQETPMFTKWLQD